MAKRILTRRRNFTRAEIARRYRDRHPDRVRATQRRSNKRWNNKPKNRAYRRRYNRRYQRANRRRIRKQRQRYYLAHRAEWRRRGRRDYRKRRKHYIRLSQRHRRSNRRYYRQYNRRYYRRNRAQIRRQQDRYRKTHPRIVFRVSPYRRRQRVVWNARRRTAKGWHTQAQIMALLVAQGWRCANPFCKRDLRKVKRHLDHKIPISRGGSNWPRNLHWLCWRCNLRKNAWTWREWLKWLRSREV